MTASGRPGEITAEPMVSRPVEAASAPVADRVVASVIIACRNGGATLQETLDSLTAQDWDRPWEIVLADNGSTDGSVAIFNAHAARHPDKAMRVQDVSERPGKAYALNRAIEASAAEWLLFCDADDIVSPGWLPAMAGALERDAFVAARMDFEALNEDWLLAYRGNAQESGLARLNHAPYALYAGGGSFAFHREVFVALDGFDPEFLHLEDTDFCVRAHLAGYELAFVPDALIHVRLRGDADAIYAQSYNYARYRALIRSRYDASQRRLEPRTWLKASQRGLILARWRVGKALKGLRGRERDEAEQATFARRAGTFMGDLAGALAYRVPPTP